MSYFIVHRSQVQQPIVIDESFSDILSLFVLHSNWTTVTHQCRDAANHVVIKFFHPNELWLLRQHIAIDTS